MIFGFNTEITYKGEKFHVQTEDRGIQRPVIETLVYKGGEIVFSRKINYSFLIGKKDLKKRVKEKLKNQHESIIEEIKQGKHDELLGFDTDETNEQTNETSKNIFEEMESEENQERENRVNKVLELIEKMPDDYFSFRFYFPYIHYVENEQSLLIVGKIENIEKESPVIGAKVTLEIKDKKGNILTSAETKTNFFGEYRIQFFCSEENKPHSVTIKVFTAAQEHTPVSFLIK